jgi:anti-sigma regulatory factor (Ser/Thr protein kinase)
MSSVTAVRPPTEQTRVQRPYAFEVAISPEPVRVAQMRRITMALLRYRAVPAPLSQDVLVAVSELVTNAIEHGHGTVGLRVRHTGQEIRIEVTDANPEPARLCTAAAHQVCDRGLILVAALAWNWGVSDDGTTTWCTFRVPGNRRDGAHEDRSTLAQRVRLPRAPITRRSALGGGSTQ